MRHPSPAYAACLAPIDDLRREAAAQRLGADRRLTRPRHVRLVALARALRGRVPASARPHDRLLTLVPSRPAPHH
jgi:hypothetical protein